MKILVYPISHNPYQKLLYRKLQKYVPVKLLRSTFIDADHAFTIGLPLFPIRFLYYRLRGFNVLHLHWLLPFVLPSDKPLFKVISTIYVLLFLLWIKLLRYKIVWTLHEISPHKPEFVNDTFIRKLISKLSDANIYHSPTAIEDARKLGFGMKKTYLIPIGNYISTYKNTISKDDARKQLGIKKDDFVFLFFGLIKPYKGIDVLLSAFEALASKIKHERLRLVIAGPSEDDDTVKNIKIYKKRLEEELMTNIEYVADDMVQIFLKSTDVVVLPYKRNTTSAAALLAFGFKKPIIAPLLGSFNDFPKTTGIYYEGNDLLNAMQKAFANKDRLMTMGEKGYALTKGLSWETIAKMTYDVYKKI